MLNVHKNTSAARAIQRVLKSREPRLIRKSMIMSADNTWVHFKSSNKKEHIRWLNSMIIQATDQYAEFRRSRRGPPMLVAYKHITIAQNEILAQKLLSKSLENKLSAMNSDNIRTIHEMESDCNSDDIMKYIFGTPKELEDIQEIHTMSVHSSLFSKTATGDPRMYIGNCDEEIHGNMRACL